MERRILLKKALTLLTEIDEAMKESTGNPYEECPFCMGELFSSEDRDLIKDIKSYLGEKESANAPGAFCETCGFDKLYNQFNFCPHCGRKL